MMIRSVAIWSRRNPIHFHSSGRNLLKEAPRVLIEINAFVVGWSALATDTHI